MRFQVPQFIEIEDKIFGPFTVKQFVYLAGGAGLSFIIYHYLNFYIAIFLMAPVIAFSLALALYKVNNRPFVFVVEAAFKYFFTDKLYIWKKTEKKPQHKEEVESQSPLYVPKLSDSKLKDLTWSLDINDTQNPGVKETMENR